MAWISLPRWAPHWSTFFHSWIFLPRYGNHNVNSTSTQLPTFSWFSCLSEWHFCIPTALVFNGFVPIYCRSLPPMFIYRSKIRAIIVVPLCCLDLHKTTCMLLHCTIITWRRGHTMIRGLPFVTIDQSVMSWSSQVWPNSVSNTSRLSCSIIIL